MSSPPRKRARGSAPTVDHVAEDAEEVGSDAPYRNTRSAAKRNRVVNSADRQQSQAPVMDSDRIISSNSQPKSPAKVTSLSELPQNLQFNILKSVSRRGVGFEHALVCKKWTNWASTAQESVTVRKHAGLVPDHLLHMLSQFPKVTSLTMECRSVTRFDQDFFTKLAEVCPGLKKLVILHYAGQLEWEEDLAPVNLDAFSSLTHLCVEEPCQVEFPKLPKLEVLYLDEGCLGTPISESDLDFVGKNMKHLQELALASPESPVRTLPPSMACLTCLTRLSLQLGQLQTLPAWVGAYQKLKVLAFSATSAEALPESLWSLTLLQMLDLHCPAILGIPSGIGNLKQLMELRLNCESLKELPGSFGTLISLKRLHLSESCMLAAAGLLQHLVKLKRLVLHLPDNATQCPLVLPRSLKSIHVEGGPGVHYLANALLTTTTLEKLDVESDGLIAGEPITEKTFKALGSSLKFLSMECNPSNIARPPTGMGHLRNLEILDIISQQFGRGSVRWCIPGSPSEWDGLVNLREVNLCSVNVTKMPAAFGKLPKLEVLSITDCEFKAPYALPSAVGNLRGLKKLVLSNLDMLRSFPKNFGQLTSLETLELEDLHLSEFPTSFQKLTQLKTLIISYCSVLHVPHTDILPSSLEELEWRSQQSNPFEFDPFAFDGEHSMPNCISFLTNLHTLRLENFAIKRLPCMKALKKLRFLEVNRFMYLKELPCSLLKLTNLVHLYVRDCPSLTRIPSRLERLPLLSESAKECVRHLRAYTPFA